MLSTKTIISHQQALTQIEAAINGPNYCFNSFGLSNGLAGKILFNCLYAKHTDSKQHLALAEKDLIQALSLIDPQQYTSFLGSSFYHDLQEFGRVIEFIHQQKYIDLLPDVILLNADTVIYDWFCKKIGRKNLGIYNGAGAAFYYFIKRSTQHNYQNLVKKQMLDYLITNRLSDDNNGLYWTNYEFTEPRLYTGSSHGNAMIINFLIEIRKDELYTAVCDELLLGAATFILNNEQSARQYISHFPVFAGKRATVPNLNLCYGDLGTALALLEVGKVLQNNKLQDKALHVLLATTRRTSVEETQIKDASILYGTSGTSVAYAKIFEASGILDFKEAGQYWYNKTPGFAVAQNDTVGFQSHFYNNQPVTNFSFSFGITGIGIHLLGSSMQLPVIQSLTDLI
ncbi:lanthionine synthetase LanC family protein [Mucilaginibacter polytrichastri]|uniref:Lanthionine synthetase C-like protein n=1 Tax=Mucilaginibacter polytrichastri TaxID=1302689 RepID=A0A1Q6A087_9SPHI|nr:lanthionine synthetase LanC family protein [Mucilaginibacter polytrichastri]OKS87430.1 hypothetical protein RG47T_2891 [Mucilaginibacter polytrichastri]SFS90541.1 Lanthionine synthetase C-like protein [Mucilaginibacter polytrichastri]